MKVKVFKEYLDTFKEDDEVGFLIIDLYKRIVHMPEDITGFTDTERPIFAIELSEEVYSMDEVEKE